MSAEHMATSVGPPPEPFAHLYPPAPFACAAAAPYGHPAMPYGPPPVYFPYGYGPWGPPAWYPQMPLVPGLAAFPQGSPTGAPQPSYASPAEWLQPHGGWPPPTAALPAVPEAAEPIPDASEQEAARPEVPAASLRETLEAMRARPHADVGDEERVCKGLVALLNGNNGGDTKKAALDWVADGAETLALSKHGCRVVQKAFDVARGSEQEMLIAPLRPHVKILCESMHGNYVLAKLVEVLPNSSVGFVPEQLRGHELATARHRTGCRVLERLIEHCTEQQMHDIVDTIVSEAAMLCKHTYGNFVLQHLIEHVPKRRAAVLSLLLPEVPSLAMHRTASHVVQKCLEFCNPEGERAIVGRLLEGEPSHTLSEVAQSRYGSFVLKQICESGSQEAREAVRSALAPFLPDLEASQYGERVAAELRSSEGAEQAATTEALGVKIAELSRKT